MKTSIFKVGAVMALSTMAFIGCDGGGSGSVSIGGSGGVIYYPYETVYGSVCQTSEPTPGCTFDRISGKRISVMQDPHYNDYGHGSDDVWFVEFDGSGWGSVYNEKGKFQYTAKASEFAGWVTGSTIGVGTTGMFWENVNYGSYWLGKNGVLYSANSKSSNFGQAINDKDAQDATDLNLAALKSDSNKKLVSMAAKKLEQNYGFTSEKAHAVASALNSWAIAAADRGKTTTKDMDKTFKAVFGVQFSDALVAVKDLQSGDTQSMKELTNRSASAMGLKPHQAQKFIKEMYKSALTEWGYSIDQINW